MTIDPAGLKALIEHELQGLSDIRVAAHVRSLLVEPKLVFRNWDYGAPGEQYPCWTVLAHNRFKTAIAYCESGFGPRCPWGLVSLASDNAGALSMSMDSGWFPRFLDAYFESFAATELPIWRVFRTGASGVREPITEEGSSDATWARAMP
jgi:hypothetical protein